MKTIVDGDRVVLSFRLVLYADDTDVSPYSIHYELKKVGETWLGEMSESWEKPRQVTLERHQ